MRVHPLQRVVDGPRESARPVHWTVPVSVGRYRVAWRGSAALAEVSSLDFVINLPTSGVYLRGRGRTAAVVDATQVALFARGACEHTTQPVAVGHTGMYLRMTPALARRLTAAVGVGEEIWRRQVPLTGDVRAGWLALWRAAHGGLEDSELYERALIVGEQIVRAVSGVGRPKPLSTDALERVREARIELAADPGARMSLDALAARVQWSRFQLCRAFRRVTQQTVHSYRDGLRMGVALEHLQDPRVDLADLAVALGYAHHSHFSARFKARFGMTPSAWRSAQI